MDFLDIIIWPFTAMICTAIIASASIRIAIGITFRKTKEK